LAIKRQLQSMPHQNRGATTEETAAAAQIGQQVFADHSRRGCPFRIEYDALHLGGEDRRGIFKLADGDLVRMDHFSVPDYVEHELRNVVLHIDLPEIDRHPAPTLHVTHDALDFLL